MTVNAPERTTTARLRLQLLEPSPAQARQARPAVLAPAPAVLPRYVRPRRSRRVGRPAHTVPGSAEVRITRRGRLALSVAVTAGLLAVGIVAQGAPVHGGPPLGAVAPGPVATVVVQPGDTVWAIAMWADPQADPRSTVARIVDLNGLAGATVRPGQTLRLPRRPRR